MVYIVIIIFILLIVNYGSTDCTIGESPVKSQFIWFISKKVSLIGACRSSQGYCICMTVSDCIFQVIVDI